MTELDLLEKYILRVKMFKTDETIAHINEAFGFLFKQPHNYYMKKSRDQHSNEHSGGKSSFSFGGGTPVFNRRVRAIYSRSALSIDTGTR